MAPQSLDITRLGDAGTLLAVRISPRHKGRIGMTRRVSEISLERGSSVIALGTLAGVRGEHAELLANLAARHGLSPTETLVALFVGTGMPSHVVARRLGLPWPLVRGVLRSVFDKARASNQGVLRLRIDAARNTASSITDGASFVGSLAATPRQAA